MKPTDYTAILEREFDDCTTLITERQQLDLKLAQKEQFIRATMNMLPEDDKQAWEFVLEAVFGEESGLSDAIRGILQSAPNKPHTASEVKKALADNKFDFSNYTTNPLSSVHAALKRLKPEEVKTENIDGVMAWRWIGPLPIKNEVTERVLNLWSEAMYGLGSNGLGPRGVVVPGTAPGQPVTERARYRRRKMLGWNGALHDALLKTEPKKE